MKEFCETLANKFPFLSYCQYGEEHIVGIVQNCDSQIASVYVYNNMHSEDLKTLFISSGEAWWWGSNRKIPINLFLKDQFKVFKPYLRVYSAKSFKIVTGPYVSIQESNAKRIKRRQIQLVRQI